MQQEKKRRALIKQIEIEEPVAQRLNEKSHGWAMFADGITVRPVGFNLRERF